MYNWKDVHVHKNRNICSKLVSPNHNYHVYIQESYIQQACLKV